MHRMYSKIASILVLIIDVKVAKPDAGFLALEA